MLADVAKLVVGGATLIILFVFRREMTWLEIVAVGAVVIGFLLFWVMLEYSLRLTHQISDSRVKISKLRHKGVQIRNKGRWEVQDEESWLKWKKKAESWNRQVTREMKKISEADAEWFRILDVVPPPRLFPGIVPKDQKLQKDFFKLYREHDFRLARLGEMIRDLWGSK